MERYLAEVMTGAGAGPADDLISSEEVRERTSHLRSAFPDLELATRVPLAEGDLVAGHFVGRGTHHWLFQASRRRDEPGRRTAARFIASKGAESPTRG